MVDETRIYLVGHSMGGGLAWDYSSDYGYRLAALVAICASNGFVNEFRSNKIAKANLSVWAFHNQDDPSVAVATTTEFTKLINSFEPDPLARKTIWSTGGHDAWTKATDPGTKEEGINIYDWMLHYSR